MIGYGYPPRSQPSVSWPRRVVEWLFILFAVAFLPFYYASSLQRVFSGSQQVVSILARYRGGILRHWPQFGGFTFLGHRLFSMRVNASFTPTWWPIIALIVGVVLRLVIANFVTNQRLKELAGESWVILTTYLALALIVSAVLNWNFLLIFILSAVVVLVYAGAYQLIANLWDGVLHTIHHVIRLAHIFFKYIAVAGTYIGEVFSDIYNFVRDLLDIVIAPFRFINRLLTTFEDELEARANSELSQLAAGQGRTTKQVPVASCLVVTVVLGIIVLTAVLLLRR